MSSWRTIRQRTAPSAPRIASSRERPVDCASCRFATFAHAISSTIATAPSRTKSGFRTSPTIASLNEAAVADSSLPIESGYTWRKRSAATPISALAVSSVTPGLSRAATARKWPWLVLAGSACRGR